MAWQLIAAEMLNKMMSSGKNELEKEKTNYESLFKRIITYPIKLIATFVFAPFLLIKTILNSNNSFFRKLIAIFGLILAAIGSYYLSTLGITVIALIVKEYLGFFSFLGYIAALMFTSWVGIFIQIGIFNFISTITLKISQQEVINYLDELADNKTEL